MHKRITALLLAICLVLTAAPVYAGAATGQQVTANAVTVTAGNTATVTLKAENFDAVATVEVYVYYDPAVLTLSSTANGSLLSGAQASVNTAEAGTVKLVAMALDGISGSGNLLTLSFKTAVDCTPGTYPIKVAVGNAYGASLTPVAVGTVNGSVTVNKPVATETFSIYANYNKSTLQKGDTLTYRVVSNSSSRRFVSADFTLEYDHEVFAFDSAALESALTKEGAIYSINSSVLGQVRITYASNEPVGTSYLFSVNLKVIADTNSTTQIKAQAANMYREDLSAYLPGSCSYTFTLKKLPEVIDYPDAFLQTEKLVVGKECKSQFYLEAGAGVAAADFTITYDPSILRCVSVTAADDLSDLGGMVIINDNYADRKIRYSYINMDAYSEADIPMITIVWEPLQSPESHYQVTVSGVGVVDAQQGALTLEYITDTGCIYQPTVTPPTCLEDGYTTFACSTCGDFYVVDPVDKLGHDIHSYEAKAETCTEVGWAAYEACSRCDYTTYEEIPALGHDEIPHVAQVVTCTGIGWEAYVTCSRCDYSTYNEIPALGHDEIFHAAQAQTCTEVGWEAYVTCSRCDYTTYEEIPALGHDKIFHAAQAQTCTEIGWEAYVTCSRCDYTTYEEIPANGHSFMDKVCIVCCADQSAIMQWDVSINGDGSVMAYAYAHMDGTYLLEIVGNGPTKNYGSSPFYYSLSGKIDDIRIADGVTSVGSYLFSNIGIQGSIQIPDSVTAIGDYAFYGFSGPKTVSLPAGVTSIGNFAFFGAKDLIVILQGDTMPSSLGSIWDYNCGHYLQPQQVITTEDATYVIDRDGKAWLAKYHKNEPEFVAETSVNGVPVTGIGAFAFDQKGEMITYTVPAEITAIGTYAFRECNRLTVLLEGSFYPAGFSSSGTDGPPSYLAPQKVIQMADRLYVLDKNGEMYLARYFGSAKDVTVEAEVDGHPVQHIGEHAFGYRSVQTVSLPNTVQTICGYAFIHSTVEQISMPSSLTKIGTWGFFGADLTSIVIPENVSVIEGTAFSYCDYLKVVYVKSSVIAQKINSTSANGNLCGYAQTVVVPAAVENTWLPVAYGYREEARVLDMDCVIYSNCDHDWQQTVVAEMIPCQTDGVTRFVCSSCAVEKVQITKCHDEMAHEAKTPNCTEIGWDAYVACSRCDYSTYQEIPALGHDEIPHEGKTATCTEIGWNAYVTCSRCDYTTYQALAELGHDYSASFIWSDDHASCEAVFSCAHSCGSEEAVACAVSDDITDPTKTIHTVTVTYNGAEFTDSVSCDNYVVSFKDWDGQTISTSYYHAGYQIILPENPVKAADNTYTYAFAGWDPKTLVCTGNATYTATYTPNYIDYTVVFQNWDGTELSKATYHYGDVVTAPADPTKTADETYTYAFTGWDKELTCTGDMTITATYESIYIGYTVVFQNWDGTELSKATYHYGDVVTAPVDPTKAADETYTYAFAGWDKKVVACAGDATYTAVYTPNFIEYTVVFQNWDGTELSKRTYHWGDTVTAPANPSKASDNTYTYAFAGWDRKVVACAGDATYTATYRPNYIDYTVVFQDWDGTELSKQTCHWGDTVTAPANPSKVADKTYTYTFAGWDKEVVACEGNATYTATYTSEYIDYTVVFQDHDGTVISQQTCHYGDAITVPADPEREAEPICTYTFAGWDSAVSVTCTGDIVYMATYDVHYIGFFVSGTVTSFGAADGEVTIKLMQGDTKKASAVSTDGTYRLLAPEPGNYSLVVSKLNHAKRTYEITVTGADITQDVTIHLLGDINGDGLLNIMDVNRANAHAKKRSTLTEYDFACADINGDGAINIMDVNRMNAHAKKRALLW